MAEFVLKDMVKKLGIDDQFHIASSATSYEEIGNPVHPGTRKKLAEYGISTDGKYAAKFTKQDYDKYDYIIAMEAHNVRDILRIVGNDFDNKVSKLLDFDDGGDIADPWYTGDFDTTYKDIVRGLNEFLAQLNIDKN